MNTLVWFKRDLRLTDHAALFHAAKQGIAVLPVYIVEPDYWQQPDVSLRHWAFVAEALTALQQQLTAQPQHGRLGGPCAGTPAPPGLSRPAGWVLPLLAGDGPR